MQTVRALIKDQYQELNLPDPKDEILSGVKWGRFEDIFTPAYWASQVWIRSGSLESVSHRLGNTIEEEVTACILCGYGMPSEIGVAAFKRIRQSGLIRKPGVSEADLRRLLTPPLEVGGRNVHYRFVNQRSGYVASALRALAHGDPPITDDLSFRSWLTTLPGIGMKTASMITRNWFDSDNVAILDIHIYRAGRLAGFFTHHDRIEKNYSQMESAFLAFADAMMIRPSILDAVIWYDMKTSGALPIQLMALCA